MKEQLMNEALADYDSLFRRVLTREQIYPDHSEYDDCLQEMRFNLIELLHDYRDLEVFKEDYNNSYLFRRFQWLCQDCRRKYLKARPETLENDQAAQIASDFDFIADVELAEMLQQIFSQLSNAEQHAFAVLLADSQFVSKKEAGQDTLSHLYRRGRGKSTSNQRKKISRQVRAYYRKKLRKKVADQIKEAQKNS
ncbi:sigma-70 family RNA polymerase sigma factor [Enterococcus dispar]|uniref:sigma-70 family RNA polymerase sigma factor n=1 Tax=Enterococcus dispar TaxID=44009 RepID=UPI0024926B25|nr:sigma-70 family RNA polymerase sigma factor [Enterococcus dispar]